LAEGLEKGIEEERKKNAKAMKAEEIDVNTIARVTGLTVDDILKM
jgi:predicted transposase/invertase (TIGR01784 family)